MTNPARLTNRELDLLIRSLTAEVTRRIEARRARDGTPTPPKGHGGRIIATEGTERLVECVACGSPFRCPRRRGRAPRSCPKCRATNTAGAHRTVPADPLTHEALDTASPAIQRRFAQTVRRRLSA